jgi:hypothetical protein
MRKALTAPLRPAAGDGADRHVDGLGNHLAHLHLDFAFHLVRHTDRVRVRHFLGDLPVGGHRFGPGTLLRNAHRVANLPLGRHLFVLDHLTILVTISVLVLQTFTMQVRTSGLQTVTWYSYGSSTICGRQTVTVTSSSTTFGTQTRWHTVRTDTQQGSQQILRRQCREPE